MKQIQEQPNQPRRVILVCACLLLLLGIGLAMANRATPATAAFVISKTDPTKGPPRGRPETVLHFAQARNSARFADTRAYIYEVYRLAPLVGIDPAFVIAQSALETADWTSFYWTNRLNPAGIGITYDGAPSYTWPDGVTAARFHLARLYVYVAGPIAPGNPLYPFRDLGPDYSHLFTLKYDGQAQVIDDLTGKWAVDPLYGQKIANRGNSIFNVPTPTNPALPILAFDASAGSNPALTRDGDIGTAWQVDGVAEPPTGAYITFDFGRNVTLERAQWRFFGIDFADDYDLQKSSNGTTWTTLETFTAPADTTWIADEALGTGRYLRFMFRNPNLDMSLGGMSEFEAYGYNTNGVPTATFTPFPSPSSTNTPLPTATPSPTPGPPTPTRTPSALPGVSIPIQGSGGSSTGTSSRAIRDGSLTTTWQTNGQITPSSAQVYVDLGDVGTITGVEFFFRRSSGARLYQIRVSNDKAIWTTMATFNYVSPMSWQRARFTVSARYVQFVFTNTNGTPVLGYLAEVKIFGSLGTFVVTEESPIPSITPSSTASATSTIAPIPTFTTVPESTSTPTAESSQASPVAIETAQPVP